jgi:hypothetical protein
MLRVLLKAIWYFYVIYRMLFVNAILLQMLSMRTKINEETKHSLNTTQSRYSNTGTPIKSSDVHRTKTVMEFKISISLTVASCWYEIINQLTVYFRFLVLSYMVDWCVNYLKYNKYKINNINNKLKTKNYIIYR